mgnify:CR=1 FL=1
MQMTSPSTIEVVTDKVIRRRISSRQQHDPSRSVEGVQGAATDRHLREEARNRSVAVLDIKALVREAYKSSKLKVEAERKVKKEPTEANGDRGGSHLLDGCRIMMRSCEGLGLVRWHHYGRYGTSHLLTLRRSDGQG